MTNIIKKWDNKVARGPRVMGANDLSIEKVFEIRRNWNPKKAFGGNATHGDLLNKTYLEIVETFKNRILNWYFAVGEFIYEKTDYTFPTIILCCVITDLLSQHIYGEPCSSEEVFKSFFKEYLKECYYQIKPPIISCYYNKSTKKWKKEEIENTADAFYHCFRCGVVHSGRILEYGRVNTLHKEIVKIEVWDKNRGTQEIHVNVILLLRKLKEVFEDYIKLLKNNEEPVKGNFIKKFKLEYGVDIKV